MYRVWTWTSRSSTTMAGSALINLSSTDGAKLLTDVQTGHHGSCCQSKLIDIFTKQISRTSCGLVSCGLVMSAYHRGKTASSSSQSSQPMAFTEQNMLNMPTTLSVISEEKMNKGGNEYADCRVRDDKKSRVGRPLGEGSGAPRRKCFEFSSKKCSIFMDLYCENYTCSTAPSQRFFCEFSAKKCTVLCIFMAKNYTCGLVRNQDQGA